MRFRPSLYQGVEDASSTHPVWNTQNTHRQAVSPIRWQYDANASGQYGPTTTARQGRHLSHSLLSLSILCGRAGAGAPRDNNTSAQSPPQKPQGEFFWVSSVKRWVLTPDTTRRWEFVVLRAGGSALIQRARRRPQWCYLPGFGSIREILFLEISLTEDWPIFVTGSRKTWLS